MWQQPIFETARLILRPFTMEDAPAVQQLAGAADVAMMTLHIPYPYEEGMAEEWISTHQPGFEAGTQITFAVTRRDNATLCGAIGLRIEMAHYHAELGYWIGTPHWGQGYATEAAKIVIRYGFADLGLQRIHASHFKQNPASGRVMQKSGMIYEGCRRQHVYSRGKFCDLELYGILRIDWQATQNS